MTIEEIRTGLVQVAADWWIAIPLADCPWIERRIRVRIHLRPG